MATASWTLRRETGPIGRPVTVRDLKASLNLSQQSTHHDLKLADKIDAATEQFEADTDRCCINQTFKLYLDKFPADGVIDIPKRPLSSVTSVKYYDDDNAEQTLSTDVYAVDYGRRQIRLDYDQQWPNHLTKPNAITVEFVAGCGSESGAVPTLYKQAIISQAAAWFKDPAMERTTNAWQNAYEAIVARLLSSGANA